MPVAVVFDLDGTLIKSRIDYEEMRKHTLEILANEGVQSGELSQSRRIWEIMLGGDKAFEEIGLPPERRREVVRRINEALNATELKALETVEPMPHAQEALETLRGRGIGIGIATRSCKAYAIGSLQRTGLAKFVDALLARDEVEHPKPDPRHLLQVVEALGVSPDDVVYIGDTTTDMKTAEDAGIAFIGFLRNDEWGRRLMEAGCEKTIDDLRMIADIVDSRSIR